MAFAAENEVQGVTEIKMNLKAQQWFWITVYPKKKTKLFLQNKEEHDVKLASFQSSKATLLQKS